MPKVRPILVWCVWPITVSLLILKPQESAEGNELLLWRQVLVSPAIVVLESQERRTFHPGPSQALYCANLCRCMGWCKLWCVDTSYFTCDFSNLKIPYNYVERELVGVLTCYTLSLKDYALTANITGHGDPQTPLRTIENLQDGYHDASNIEDCFRSKQRAAEQWILLDFGKIVTFNHVILGAPPNKYAYRLFRDLEVRVGNSTPMMTPDDFSAFDLFGKFAGQASPSQIVDLSSPSLVSARFMSVQKMSGSYNFQLCYISVPENIE